MLKRQIPNMLTTLRIVATIGLIVIKPLSGIFMLLYIIAGITDMLDGFLARKLKVASQFGEKYDSFADFLFVIVCMGKLLPMLKLEYWHLVLLGGIVIVKITNLIVAYRQHTGKFFLHTNGNKLTGFLLFLYPILFLYADMDYIMIGIGIIALFAALQEGYLLRRLV